MSIGERLRVERKRLNFSQQEFGSIGGVTRNSQAKYERGETVPDVNYLEKIGEVGADLFYLMTGDRIDDQPEADPEQFEQLLNDCVDILFDVQKELGITLDSDMYKNALSFAFTSRASRAQMLKFVSAVISSINGSK